MLPSLETLIAQYGLSAKKSLGQHFLLNAAITHEIVKYAGDVSQGSVIEVGPGPGGLTRSLLAAGATVYAIEKDGRCLAALQSLAEAYPQRLHLIGADALTIDMEQFPAPRRIVANLPYNVGTELLIGWLHGIYHGGRDLFACLTLMFQKEVAERIAAAPGGRDFGRLSVLAQWLCEVRYDLELPPEAFSPPPKVYSAVITLTPRGRPLADVPLEVLEKVVAAAFGQRRKMLRSALKPLGLDTEQLLAGAGIDPTLRAEQLSVEQLCGLAKHYMRMKN